MNKTLVFAGQSGKVRLAPRTSTASQEVKVTVLGSDNKVKTVSLNPAA